jgi:hypothetical protein
MVDLRLLSARRPSRRAAPTARRGIALCAVVWGLLAPSTAFSWGNSETHQRLADAAFERFNADGSFDEFLRKHYGLEDGFLQSTLTLRPEISDEPGISPVWRTYYDRIADAFASGRFRVKQCLHQEPPPGDSTLGAGESGAEIQASLQRLLRAGVWAEDVPNPRARHHFHDPEVPHPDPTGNRGMDNQDRTDDLLSDPLTSQIATSILCFKNNLFDGPDAFDFTGLSAMDRALNRSPDGGTTTPKLAPPGPNDFDLSDAERYLYRYVVGQTEAERDHAIALHFLAFAHALHLLQDMSSPAHVRNDFVIDHLLPALASTFENDPVIDFGDVGAALEEVGQQPPALALIARLRAQPTLLFESGPYQFLNLLNFVLPEEDRVDLSPFLPVIPQANTSGFDVPDFWHSEFATSPTGPLGPGLAEAVHDQFFSRDALPLRNPDGYQRPNPSVETCERLPLRGPDGKGVPSTFGGGLAFGYFVTSPAVPHLAACNFHTGSLQIESGQIPLEEVRHPFTVISDSVHRDYMELLFPLAIDYTEKFVRSYFRPRIEVMPTGENEFTVRNLTPFDFWFVSDAIEIAYDDIEGNRQVVPVMCGAELTELRVPASEMPGEPGDPGDFSCAMPSSDDLPTEPADRGDFWVAARGKLGSRGSAVSLEGYDLTDLLNGTFSFDFALAFQHVRGRQVLYQEDTTGSTDSSQRLDSMLAGVEPLDPFGLEQELPAATNPTAVLRTNANHDFPRPHAEPLGTRIVFRSDHQVSSQRYPDDVGGNPIIDGVDFHTYLMDLAVGPTSLQRLTNDPRTVGGPRNPLWSRTGDAIFFWENATGSDEEESTLYRYNPVTGTRSAIGITLPEDCENSFPDLVAAYDASTLAINVVCTKVDEETSEVLGSGFDLFIMNVFGSTASATHKIDVGDMRVRSCGGTGCPAPSDFTGEGFGADFSPDGNELVFTSRQEGLGERHLFVANFSTNGIQSLVTDVCVARPAVSGDGVWIAFPAVPTCDNVSVGFVDFVVMPATGGPWHVLRNFVEIKARGRLSWYEPLLLP